jgi:hypothetical protein
MKVSARPIEARPHMPQAPRVAARSPRQASIVAVAHGASCLFADRRDADARRPEKLAIEAGETGLPKPIVLAALPLAGGGTRHLVLVGEDASALARRRIELVLDGGAFATLDPEWLQSPHRPLAEVIRNLSSVGVARLAKLLVTAGARHFAGARGGEGLLALLGLLGAARLGPSRWYRTGTRSGILSVPVPPTLVERPEALVLVADGTARYLPPARVLLERTKEGGWLHVMLPGRPGPGSVVAGIAERPFTALLPAGAALPLAPALAQHDTSVSAWVEAALAESAGVDEVAAAVLEEIRSADAGSGAIRIAEIARTRRGIFLSAEGLPGRSASLRIAAGGQAADLVMSPHAPPVVYAALPGPVRSDDVVTVTARRRSGRSDVLHCGPVPAFAPEPRLLPMAGPALAQAVLDLAEPVETRAVKTIGRKGKARPLAVLARFGSEEALRALVASLGASLGAGRKSPRADLVVLAEAGDDADRARAILQGCHAVFAEPASLISVEPGISEAAALAAALRVTGNDRVLLLGRDVLPLGAAWPAAWERAIRPRSAAPVGGTLLGPDGTILHAGGRLAPGEPYGKACHACRTRAASRLPARSAIQSTLFSGECVGLGRAAIDGFVRGSAFCPDAATLLSVLALREGGTTRRDCRAVRYGGEPDDGAVWDALRPHMLAALIDAARHGASA